MFSINIHIESRDTKLSADGTVRQDVYAHLLWINQTDAVDIGTVLLTNCSIPKFILGFWNVSIIVTWRGVGRQGWDNHRCNRILEDVKFLKLFMN